MSDFIVDDPHYAKAQYCKYNLAAEKFFDVEASESGEVFEERGKGADTSLRAMSVTNCNRDSKNQTYKSCGECCRSLSRDIRRVSQSDHHSYCEGVEDHH